jgi:hypothetical protein
MVTWSHVVSTTIRSALEIVRNETTAYERRLELEKDARADLEKRLSDLTALCRWSQ